VKVLSVDDSSIMRKIIRSALDRLGYEVLEAENGIKALEVLQQHYGDIVLILLDWNMPTMDGFTTLEEIKKDSRFQQIPVMMVTTEAERSNAIKALKAGASHYVTKPFSQEDLLKSVMECLGMGSA
jgi:two-component system, chemotaxis family, chemotaxis protein CheY